MMLLQGGGGDEFLLLLPNTTSEIAQTVINNIKATCREKSDGILQLSIGLGYAIKTGKEKMEIVVQEAEEMMYYQKLLESGKLKNDMTNILLRILYERNLESEEHKNRIVADCKKIGENLKLNEEEMKNLELLAEVHNIGFLGINQDVGQGALEKWEELKRHAEIGYRIAQYTPKYSVVAEYVLAHHEHWDGSGYPRGLKADNIPLLSRILAVADAYETMTNDNACQKHLTNEEAFEELKRNAGTKFDPNIVDMFYKKLNC